MKGILIIVIALIVISTLIAGCATKAPATVTSPDIKQYSNPAQTIVVSVGEKFEIDLESNATTGYSWQGNEVYDEEMLQLVNSQYLPAQTDRVGAGGKQVYLFQALKAGNTKVNLTYKRSWETTEFDKVLNFDISIK